MWQSFEKISSEVAEKVGQEKRKEKNSKYNGRSVIHSGERKNTRKNKYCTVSVTGWFESYLYIE